MIYSELKTAILSDTHREDYSPYVVRFIQQAEALIALSLDGYFLSAALTDADRAAVGSNVYWLNLPSVTAIARNITTMRTVLYGSEPPLTQMDETLIQQHTSSTRVFAYCMRDNQILFAGTPPVGAIITLNYYGMPKALVLDSDTNNLLNDCPQLYIEAAQVYLFKRARNFEASSAMFQSVQLYIKEINRRMKKKLGGGQSANAYNVSFRSSF